MEHQLSRKIRRAVVEAVVVEAVVEAVAEAVLEGVVEVEAVGVVEVLIGRGAGVIRADTLYRRHQPTASGLLVQREAAARRQPAPPVAIMTGQVTTGEEECRKGV
jgi:hypothetical protein